MTRRRISLIVTGREPLLSFQTGFGLGPSLVSVLFWRAPLAFSFHKVIDLMYLNPATVSRFSPSSLVFILMPFSPLLIGFIFCKLTSIWWVDEVWRRRLTRSARSGSLPSTLSKSSAYQRMLIALSTTLTGLWFLPLHLILNLFMETRESEGAVDSPPVFFFFEVTGMQDYLQTLKIFQTNEKKK